MRFCVFGRELSRAVRFCECDVEDLGFVLLFFFSSSIGGEFNFGFKCKRKVERYQLIFTLTGNHTM